MEGGGRSKVQRVRKREHLDPYGRLLSGLEHFVKGDRWKLRSTLVLVLLSFFLHYPSYQHLHQHLSGELIEENWSHVEWQRDALLSPASEVESDRLKKTTFRLTVPVIARTLHLGPLGIYLLQVLLGVLLIHLTLTLAHRHTQDRVMALFFTTGLVCTYAGSAAFFDTWGHFDAFAYFLLVLALASRRAPVIFGAVLLAAFTDERALIASAFVLLYHGLERRDGATTGSRSTWPAVVAVCASWSTYFAVRYCLNVQHGFATDTSGIGMAVMWEQINPLAWGLWTGLEGAWLLVLAFFVMLGLARDGKRMGLYGGALLVLIVVTSMVTDLTRSMAYAFVMLFPILAWLHGRLHADQLRTLLFFACLVSLLHPMYYTFGKDLLYPVDSMPIKALRALRLMYL